MLGFVLAAAPRIGFIVTCLTLHVGAFHHKGAGLGVPDLYVLGVALLGVQIVATSQLVKHFSGGGDEDEAPAEDDAPSWGAIAGYGAIGLLTSVLGGHAVGDFADILVKGLEQAGYPEMVGALLLSVFASAGALAMIITSHAKKMYDVALASAAGQVSQVPFVVLPVALILLAVLAQTSVIPMTESGSVLPIDLETTSVMLLAFPPMLLLWKAVRDDGKVSWVETAAMVCVFGIVVYMLAMHG